MPVDISKLTKEDVARKMDYSILHPEWQDKETLDGIEMCKKYKFVAYYVLPHWIPLTVSEMGDFAEENDIEIGTGIAFPYGSDTTKAKLESTEDLIEKGCTVLDMVANPAWIKDKKYDLYKKECSQFVELCHDAGLVAKIIIRVGYLDEEQTRTATRLVVESGADFVKTATGQGPKGRPNMYDVKFMLDTLDELGSDCQLKVSGVIEPRILNAYAFITMGAARIGTRGAVKIVEGLDDYRKLMGIA